jgi:uncharacterized protein (TIGR02452 family)
MFIRDADLNLVKEPVTANIVTSPAVNAGAFYKNENDSELIVQDVMALRISFLLKLFASKKNKIIILGAFGCGVFGNDVNIVANIFHNHLVHCKYGNHFEKIIFAVYDPKGQQYNIFKQRFNLKQ